MKTTKIRRCVICGTILLTSQHNYCNAHKPRNNFSLPPMKRKPPVAYSTEDHWHTTIDPIDFLLTNEGDEELWPKDL